MRGHRCVRHLRILRSATLRDPDLAVDNGALAIGKVKSFLSAPNQKARDRPGSGHVTTLRTDRHGLRAEELYALI